MMIFRIIDVKFVYNQFQKNIVFWGQENIQKKLFRKLKFLDIKKKYLHINFKKNFSKALYSNKLANI